MAALRSGTGIIAFGVLLLFINSSCTGRTPGYCDLTRQIGCPRGQACLQMIHTCVSSDGGEDVANGDGADAAADAATDGGGDVKTGCDLNTDCLDPAAPACDKTARKCVACVADTDCPDTATPACDKTVPMCVGCLADTDCKTTAKPVCDTTAMLCVGCLAAKDCTANPAMPICDAKTSACRACQADSECTSGPGVCMFHQDGHCATNAETLYVQNTTSCPGAGSSASPYCAPQDAISHITTTVTTIVMRGPTALDRMNIAGTLASQVTVIGQSGAFIAPGAAAGLQISGGADVYVRGLTVSGGASVGLMASANAVLRMDRCIVESNALGGIEIDGAGFDIVNTVVAKNGPGSTGPASWGGIYIGTVPSGKPMQLLNDTIADNLQVGLSCATAPQSGGLIVTGSSGGVDVTTSCMVTPCCTTNLLLTADYHLMAGSSCIDQLAPAMAAPDDIDGQTRPQGATMLSDCGADEYTP